MIILPKAIYRFDAISIRIPVAFFTELEHIILKFVWKTQKTPNSQNWFFFQDFQSISRLLEKEKQSWRYHTPWFQTILYKATVIKTVWYRHKNRHIDKCNNIESPEMNPYFYGQLIYDQGLKNTQREKTASSINGAEKTGQLHTKESNWTTLTPCTKIHSLKT